MPSITLIASDPRAKSIATQLAQKLKLYPVKLLLTDIFHGATRFRQPSNALLEQLETATKDDYFFEILVSSKENTNGSVPDVIILDHDEEPKTSTEHLLEIFSLADIDADYVDFPEDTLLSHEGHQGHPLTLQIKSDLDPVQIENIGSMINFWMELDRQES